MNNKEEVCCWINEKEKIIAFHMIPDFICKVFESRLEMMDFACEVSRSGYRVQ
jgi:hypothetical protein